MNAIFDERSQLCCKDLECTEWCEPGSADCGDLLVDVETSDLINAFLTAGAQVLDDFADNVPPSDGTHAESPWNLNDWIADLATGDYHQIALQATALVEALRTVDWDSAFYSLTGSNDSDEASLMAQACESNCLL